MVFINILLTGLSTMKNRIYNKIKEGLNPEFLEVENKSHLHRGHAGDDGSGETHFLVIVKDESLKKLGRVAAHRKINELVRGEFVKGLHALEIKFL